MKYKGYLIDLDGTMYRGKEPIAGAKEFIESIQKAGLPYVFVTNNSSSTNEMIVKKLASFGIHTNEDHILTSATATAKYIARQKNNAKCFMIGEKGLEEALNREGIQLVDHLDTDYVVIGIDREITYDKLKKAALSVRNGASFISTNKDAAIPTEEGLLPGNGSLTSVITVSTGVEPTFIGKPEKIIMEEALQMVELQAEDVLMVGDNYTTDILAGIRANIDTLMVLTGYTKKEEMMSLPSEKHPTYIKANLLEWLQIKSLP